MARRQLEPRERNLIVIAAAVLGLIVLGPMAQDFAHDYARVQSQVDDAKTRLTQIREMRELVLEERSGRRIIQDRLGARNDQFDLYTFSSDVLKELKLAGNARLSSQNSRFSGGAIDVVQLNLVNINMKQLIDLLHRFHSSENLIAMQRLGHLRPAHNNKGLECEIVLMAPKA